MFFSVLIPVYNVEKYLAECIESVLSQKEKDYEIILCDDGSTDNSGKICDEYREKYPDIIKVIHKENEGLLLTRRKMLKVSKGDWIVHLDSDDYMLPDLLLTVKKTALADKDLDFIFFKYIKENKNDSAIRELPFSDGQIFQGKDKILLYRQLCIGKYFNGIWMKVCKRNIIDIDFDYYQFPKIYKSEDKLQSLPLLDNCHKAIFLDKVFYYYRYNENSICNKKDNKIIIKSIKTFPLIWKRCEFFCKKWGFSEEEINYMYFVNLNNIVMNIKRVCKHSNYYQFKEFIAEISKIVEIYELYDKCDKKKLGRKLNICYKLFIKKQYFILFAFILLFVFKIKNGFLILKKFSKTE